MPAVGGRAEARRLPPALAQPHGIGTNDDGQGDGQSPEHADGDLAHELDRFSWKVL